MKPLFCSAALALAFAGVPAQPAAGDPVLQFTIGMHIEPFGTTEAGFRAPIPLDYRQPQFFARHVEDIQMVARIIERHGGRMTVQAQSPFTSMAVQSRNPVLAELAARGHEIALHFHEDAHLGPQFAAIPPERWCAVMRNEIRVLQQAAPTAKIRYWSGGNTYRHLFLAASCAGLDLNSDWKNPATQSTPLEILGIHPWRPAGGTDGKDLGAFLRHDPGGPVVFLPEGQFDNPEFASMRRSDIAGGDAAYFESLARALLASLDAARQDRVNVFHFTIHPGEFRGDPRNPFALIERFLTEVVDPLVAAGRIRWATFTQMGDAFIDWEGANPDLDPR